MAYAIEVRTLSGSSRDWWRDENGEIPLWDCWADADKKALALILNDPVGNYYEAKEYQ